jgi:thymidine phosphorylase
VKEILLLLHGGGPADLREVTVLLAAEMLVLGGVAATLAEGRARIEQAISDGRGLRKLCEIVEAQGGDPRALVEPDRLPRAAKVVDVASPASGIVEAIDAEAVGLAAMALGAGRTRVEDAVDPAAGLEVWKKVGDRVEAGEPIAAMHLGSRPLESPDAVAARLRAAWRIGAGPASPGPLVLHRIEGGAT